MSTAKVSFSVLRLDAYPIVPWRNGAGVTREIACSPVGASAEEFDWRVSIADVRPSSTFSTFAGVDRVILPLDPPPMVLTVDGTPHELTRHEPFAFDGEAVTSCQVDGGPSRDLNVMTRRGRIGAAVVVLDDALVDVDSAGDRATLVVVLSGARSALSPESASPLELGGLDALVLRGGAVAQLSGSGRLAVIRLA